MRPGWLAQAAFFYGPPGVCGKTPVAGRGSPQRLNRLLKNSWRAPQSPSAAKAVAENKSVIAAVNRCATQKQEQIEFFSTL